MLNISRRTALKIGAASSLTLAMAGPAQALVKIIVTGGDFVPLPISIPNFSAGDGQFGRDVADVVRADLRRSGLFAITELGSGPVSVGNPGVTPDFTAWRDIGADALVMGQVARGVDVRASVRVWDTLAGQQVVGESYTSGAGNWRRIGHIVADAIYKSLTGEEGYFDTRVVYVAETGPKANRVKRLAIMDQDGANVQYLTSGKSLTLTPRYSPDGLWLTYMNYQDGNPRVFLLELATGRQQQIGNFGQMTFSPRFSPDGRRLAFSVEQGGTTNLYALDIGGNRPVQLTSGAAIDTAPSYAPDGQHIAFESDRGGAQQIYIMSAAGGGAQRISYGQGSYSTPVWSPKGDLIAFTKRSGGQFHIGTMKPDGSGERILVSRFHAEGPSWAPNGRVIMFFSDPGGNDGSRLYSVDIWGRNEQSIVTESFASDPTWSPLLN